VLPPAGCEKISGNICTFAGTGVAGLGGEDLPPEETELYLPQDVTVMPDGRVVVLDWNNHRVRLAEGGGMRTLIGTGRLGEGLPGAARETSLNHPTHVSVAPDGSLTLAAWHNSKIMRYDFDTDAVEVLYGNGQRSFGGDDGPAADAIFDLPVATAYALDGSLCIADQGNQRVRHVGSDGVIRTIVGTGAPGFGGDGGPAANAQLDLPTGQQAPPTGRISMDGAGSLYIVDTGNERIRRVDTDGVIETVAGNGEPGKSGDGGPAVDASLNHPNDAEVDLDGNVYIADTNNSCVRKVAPDGIITTAAGLCGERGRDGDGGPATDARLDRPYGVTTDAEGNLYIADTHAHRVRIVWR
jgi:sugar lactone lactonase YvrE